MSTNPYANRQVKEKTEYPRLADGDYKVNGILDYFSTDERELPVFTTQSGNDQMVARLHLRQTNGTQGPAMSLDRNRLILLAKAFGADIRGLPDQNSTTFLVEIQTRANAAAKEQTARVNGGEGWAKYVSGTNPETNVMYCWKFTGFSNAEGEKDERLQFKSIQLPGKKGGQYYQSFAHAWFRLEGDMYGRPTPYDGYSTRLMIVNPFWGVDNKTGEQTNEVSKIAVERWDTFVKLFCPDMDNWNWTTDPEQSPYGTDELANPIVVFDGEAKKTGRKGLAAFKVNEKGYPKMDILDFVPFDPPVDLDARKAEETSQPSELFQLVELIDQLCEESLKSKAFEPTDKSANKINLTFTDAGKAWAKEHLVPAWETTKLPVFEGKRLIGKLDGVQCALLERTLRNTFGKNKAPKNEALTDEGAF